MTPSEITQLRDDLGHLLEHSPHVRAVFMSALTADPSPDIRVTLLMMIRILWENQEGILEYARTLAENTIMPSILEVARRKNV